MITMTEYVEKVEEANKTEEKTFEVFEEGVDKDGNAVTYKSREMRLNKTHLEQEKVYLQEKINEIDEKLALFIKK